MSALCQQHIGRSPPRILFKSLYVENDITIQYYYYLLTSAVAQDMNARRQKEELLNKKETPVSTNNALGVTTWKGGYSWIRF